MCDFGMLPSLIAVVLSQHCQSRVETKCRLTVRSRGSRICLCGSSADSHILLIWTIYFCIFSLQNFWKFKKLPIDNKIIATKENLETILAFPYIWAMKSMKKFDCSNKIKKVQPFISRSPSHPSMSKNISINSWTVNVLVIICD